MGDFEPTGTAKATLGTGLTFGGGINPSDSLAGASIQAALGTFASIIGDETDIGGKVIRQVKEEYDPLNGGN